MHDLNFLLSKYRPFHETQFPEGITNQNRFADAFEALLQDTTCWDRTLFNPGHFTASALVVSPDYSQLLFTLHKKLGKWLQLGGHADGDKDLVRVALKEVEEESGLKKIHLAPIKAEGHLFDLDIHEIPARKQEPKHLHYDARFVVIAEEPQKIQISEESSDLKWFSWKEIENTQFEPSLSYLIEKFKRYYL